MANLNAQQSKAPVVSAPVTPQDLRLRTGYDVLLLALFALMIPGLLLLPPSLFLLRVPLGLFAVLFAPGYVLQAALFAGREDLDGVARSGLSFGLSVALIPLAALLLDNLPWGIRPWPIALLFMAWILSGCLIIVLRRTALLPAGKAFVPPDPHPGRWWSGLSPRLRLAYAGGMLALTILFGAAYFAVTTPVPSSYLTEFYVLGRSGLAEDYPREAAIGAELSVTLGITNREREAHSYRVELWAVDPWQDGRRELLNSVGPLELTTDQTYEQPVTWAMPWAGDDQTVELYLFKDDSKEPYRQLKLWLNVTSSSSK